MTERDTFIQQQLPALLQPGEQVLNTAAVVKQPGLLWQLLLFGGLLLFLMTKAYYAVATDRRVILIRTKMGMWGPKMVNLGTEIIDNAQISKVTTSGFANNRSITFHTQSGANTVRIAPWSKIVTGQKEFLEQVPDRLNGRPQLTA